MPGSWGQAEVWARPLLCVPGNTVCLLFPCPAALAAESAKLLASGLCHRPLLPETLWRACPQGEAHLEPQQPLGLPASRPGVTRTGGGRGGSPSAPASLSRDGLQLLRNLISSACCPPSPAPDPRRSARAGDDSVRGRATGAAAAGGGKGPHPCGAWGFCSPPVCSPGRMKEQKGLALQGQTKLGWRHHPA